MILYRLSGVAGIENGYLMPVVCTVLTIFFMILPAWIVRQYVPGMIGEKTQKN